MAQAASTASSVLASSQVAKIPSETKRITEEALAQLNAEESAIDLPLDNNPPEDPLNAALAERERKRPARRTLLAGEGSLNNDYRFAKRTLLGA